ncbi:MAG: hypothetical protein HC929_23310 [Leptolyngbyaceae cyanobacterium SM2_5_2]|nr:hypothetical protein [Leptolyngbyaceae cyanobacterium SM2_5_2]
MQRRVWQLVTTQERLLEASWKRNWKNLTVRLDGRLLAVIPDIKAYKSGKEFVLEDGSGLNVQLSYSGAVPFEIVVLHNSKLLSPKANRERWQRICILALLLITISTLITGFSFLTITSPFLNLIFFSRFASGGIFLLAILVDAQASVKFAAMILLSSLYFILLLRVRRKSWIALAIALTLFSLDTFSFGALIFVAASGESAVFAGMLISLRLVLLMAIVAGFLAFDSPDNGLTRPASNFEKLVFRFCKFGVGVLLYALALLLCNISI